MALGADVAFVKSPALLVAVANEWLPFAMPLLPVVFANDSPDGDGFEPAPIELAGMFCAGPLGVCVKCCPIPFRLLFGSTETKISFEISQMAY